MFPSDVWKAYGQQWVLVAVDFPSSNPPRAMKDLARQYRVNQWPTLLGLDADGKELGRQVGAVSMPSTYIELLETAGIRPPE